MAVTSEALSELSTSPFLNPRSTGHRNVPPGGVTPDELRNLHLRESFRGYHRDHVDALCERAAETIEHLERRVDDLDQRLRHVLDRRSGTEPVRSASVRRGDRIEDRSLDTIHEVDVVQRTLTLAQQAADEAIAEAQSRAQRLVGDAEITSAALVTEAESTARRIADQERTRAATEVAELDARRRALRADVDVLEHFTSEFRERIQRAIESELGRLGASAVAAVAVPTRPLLLDGITEGIEVGPPAAELDQPEPVSPRPFALGTGTGTG